MSYLDQLIQQAGGSATGEGPSVSQRDLDRLRRVQFTPQDLQWIEEAVGGDPNGVKFLKTVGAVENRGKPGLDDNAVSEAGAVGAYQFMPETARAYGLDPAKRTDRRESIFAAGRYYQDLNQRYGGNFDAMLADYNGGPRQAKPVLAGNAPPAAQTQEYLRLANAYNGVDADIAMAARETDIDAARGRIAGMVKSRQQQAIPTAAPTGGYIDELLRTVSSPAQPETGTEGMDYVKAFGAGVAQLGTMAGGALDYADFNIAGPALRDASSELSQSILQSMTPEAQERIARQWTTLDPNKTIWQGGAGEFISSTLLQLSQTAPSSLVTLVPGALMFRAGMGAGAISYLGASEGVMSLGSIAANIAEEINTAPVEELRQSERFVQLEQQHGEAQARVLLAEEAQGAAPAIGGAIVGAISAAAGRYLAPIFEKGEFGIGERFARGAINEGLFQEAPQSGAEQIAQNIAAQMYDKSRSTTEGVGEAMVQGGVLGGLMGGGTSALLGRGPQPEAAPVPATEPSTPGEDFYDVFGPGGPARNVPRDSTGKPVLAQFGEDLETWDPEKGFRSEDPSFLDERRVRDLQVTQQGRPRFQEMDPAYATNADPNQLDMFGPDVQGIQNNYGQPVTRAVPESSDWRPPVMDQPDLRLDVPLADNAGSMRGPDVFEPGGKVVQSESSENDTTLPESLTNPGMYVEPVRQIGERTLRPHKGYRKPKGSTGIAPTPIYTKQPQLPESTDLTAPTLKDANQLDMFEDTPASSSRLVDEMLLDSPVAGDFTAAAQQVEQEVKQEQQPEGGFRVRVTDEKGNTLEDTVFDSREIADEYANGVQDAYSRARVYVTPVRPKLGLKKKQAAPGQVFTAAEPAPDEPSAEGLADIRAQIEAMRAGKTGRNAVYLSPANVAHMRRTGALEELSAMGVPLPNYGERGDLLIAKDRSAALKAQQARQRLSKQEAIGWMTGAGKGKPAGATDVVQLLDDNGNVIRESLVAKQDIQKTIDEFGKKNVRVLTIQAALARRQKMVQDDMTLEGRKRQAENRAGERKARSERDDAQKWYTSRLRRLLAQEGVVLPAADLETIIESSKNREELGERLLDYAANVRQEEEARAQIRGVPNPADLTFENREVVRERDETGTVISAEVKTKEDVGKKGRATVEEDKAPKGKRYADLYAKYAATGSEETLAELKAMLEVERPRLRSTYLTRVAKGVAPEAAKRRVAQERKTATGTIEQWAFLVDRTATEVSGNESDATREVGKTIAMPPRSMEQVRADEETSTQTMAAKAEGLADLKLSDGMKALVKRMVQYFDPAILQSRGEVFQKVKRLLPAFLSDYIAAMRAVPTDTLKGVGNREEIIRELGILSEQISALGNTEGDYVWSIEGGPTDPDAETPGFGIDTLKLDALIAGWERKLRELTTRKAEAVAEKASKQKVTPVSALARQAESVLAQSVNSFLSAEVDPETTKLAEMSDADRSEALSKMSDFERRQAITALKYHGMMKSAQQSRHDAIVTFGRLPAKQRLAALKSLKTKRQLLGAQKALTENIRRLRWTHTLNRYARARAAMPADKRGYFDTMIMREYYGRTANIEKLLAKYFVEDFNPIEMERDIRALTREQQRISRKLKGVTVKRAVKSKADRELIAKIDAASQQLDRLYRRRAELIKAERKAAAEQRKQKVSGTVKERAAYYAAAKFMIELSESSRRGVGNTIDEKGFIAALRQGAAKLGEWLEANVTSRAAEDRLVDRPYTPEELRSMPETKLNVVYLEAMGRTKTKRSKDGRLAAMIHRFVTDSGKGVESENIRKLVREWVGRDWKKYGWKYFTFPEMVRSFRQVYPDAPLPKHVSMADFLETLEPSEKRKFIIRVQEVLRDSAYGKGESAFKMTRDVTRIVPEKELGEQAGVKDVREARYDYRVLVETQLPQSWLDSKGKVEEERAKTERLAANLSAAVEQAKQAVMRVVSDRAGFLSTARSQSTYEESGAQRISTDLGKQLNDALEFVSNLRGFAESALQITVTEKQVANSELQKLMTLLTDDLSAVQRLAASPRQFIEKYADLMVAERQRQERYIRSGGMQTRKGRDPTSGAKRAGKAKSRYEEVPRLNFRDSRGRGMGPRDYLSSVINDDLFTASGDPNVDLDNRKVARAVADMLETQGDLSGLNEAITRIWHGITEDHPLFTIVDKLHRANLTNVTISYDRRRGERVTDWKANEGARLIYSTDHRGNQVMHIVLRRELFTQLRERGIDPSPKFVSLIVHEAIHAVTVGELESNAALRKEFEALMEFAKGFGHKAYGFTDVYEFVAEAYSNPVFQNYLKRLTLPPARQTNFIKTAWDWFRRTVLARVFKSWAPDTKTESVFDRVMSMTNKVMTNAPRTFERNVMEMSGIDFPSESLKNAAFNVIDRVTSSNTALKEANSSMAKLAESAGNTLTGVKLSLLTMRQLQSFYSKWFPAGSSFQSYFNLSAARDAAHSKLLGETDAMSQPWTKLEDDNPEQAKRLSSTMTWATYYSVDPTKPFNPDASSRENYDLVKKLYDGLDAKARKIYADVSKYYKEVRQEQADLLVLHALRAYAVRHGVMTAEGFDKKYTVEHGGGRNDVRSKELNTIEGIKKEFGEAFMLEKDEDADDSEDKFDAKSLRGILRIAALPSKRVGPYFPLRRKGDYVITYSKHVKTHSFLTRQERNEFIKGAKLKDPGVVFKFPARGTESDTGPFKLEEYDARLERFDTKTEAKARRAEMAAEYGDKYVSDVMLTDAVMKTDKTVVDQSIDRLLNSLKGNTAAQTAIKQMYLRQLEEHSIRKLDLHRENRKGFSDQMQHENFAFYSKSMAYYLAQLRYGRRLATALANAQKEAKENSLRVAETTDLQEVVNELRVRDELSADMERANALVRKGVELGQFFLLVGPSYWMLNATQPFTFTAPYLASEYGVAKMANAMKHAQMLIADPLVQEVGATWGGLRGLLPGGRSIVDKAFGVVETVKEQIKRRSTPEESKDLLNMIDDLSNKNILNFTLITELRELAEGESRTAWSRVMDASRIMGHLTEVNNRLVTAIAAYRLARNGGLPHDLAVLKAEKAVADTQFDLSSSNRPRAFSARSGPLRPLVFQFMSYVQHTYALLIRTYYEATQGNPQEMKVARKRLLGILSTHLAMGGVIGATLQPIKWAIGAVLALFGGADDEDRDILSVLSGKTYDKTMRDALDEILPTSVARTVALGGPSALGADLSQRLALGQMYMVDIKTESSDAFWGSLLTSFGGAWLGLLNNGYIGAKYFAEGDIQKGIEATLPKIVKDLAKTYRYSTEGLTDRTGKTLIAAEDMSPVDLFLQAAGVTPTSVRETYAGREAQMDAKEFRNRQRKRLLQRMNKGDDVRDDIKDFNQRFPQWRITVSDIQRSRAAFRRNQRSLDRYGAVLTKRERAIASEADPYSYDEEE